MPWFKVDDNLAFHPKVLAAGNQALGLWVRAGSWAAQQLTDGHVPTAMVQALGTSAQAERLIRSGLWLPATDGYQFHQWVERQPSRADVQLTREAESSSGSWGNHRRWHTNRGVSSPDCKHCQND